MKSNTPTVWITGVSSGIGLALATLLLDKGYRVVGIGRTSTISHPRFVFRILNLGDTQAVNRFAFEDAVEGDILINNAGIIGDIAPCFDVKPAHIDEVFGVNTMSAIKLANNFSAQLEAGTILFISSGAAQRPIKGWGAYCASKASIDMYARVMQEELIHHQKEFTIKSLAPGVVDSPMQAKVRLASPDKFPDSDNFHQLFLHNELDAPELTARKLFFFLRHIDEYSEVLCTLRAVNLPD
jgi:benzil reductase ((S)-benzoin forming)